VSVAERLGPDRATRRTDAARFDFTSTAQLPPLEGMVGQDRALAALEFALDCRSRGFNAFCLGLPGTGKRRAVLAALTRRTGLAEAPPDWCYVADFDDARRPRALCLPGGSGRAFRDDVDHLLTTLEEELPRGFASDAYMQARRGLVERVESFRRIRFGRATEEARQKGIASLETSSGLMLAPLREGRVLSPEELAALEPAEQESYERSRRETETVVLTTLAEVAAEAERAREEVRRLDRGLIAGTIGHRLNALRDRYGTLAPVVAFLRALEADLLDVLSRVVAAAPDEDPRAVAAAALANPEFRRRYGVNLLVDHAATPGVPVLEEPNPTVGNLLGRVEHRFADGAWVSDHSMLRAGALHRANGGYLVLEARELLARPGAWQALMAALRAGTIAFPTADGDPGVASGAALEPEPIPVAVKVLLLGPPLLYYYLQARDADFREQFKVKVEFAPTVERTPETELAYARFAGTIARLERLPHCDREAAALLVDAAARMAGEQDRLTACFSDVADLLREAAVTAGARGAGLVEAADLRQALEARRHRGAGHEDELRRRVALGELLIHTRGTQVGRINGLAVLRTGDHSFGRPVSLVATVAVGTTGLVNIEREIRMSGPIHSKGILTLGGYLNRRYGGERPLVFNATLGFEQLYEEVDGDSASVAELVALLSAISGIPLLQALAVTGSVNEAGEVQPVGGVTEKVEGFFDACRVQELTGEQGVVLPARSARQLVLREEVVAAVAEGRFRLWAASSVDEVVALLTGRPADEVHGAVVARLEELLAIGKAQRRG
jgi:lon-related putative ATP-dependent protease